MNKIAIAALSLAAAFGAHAQSANDAYDQAGYGAMAAAKSTVATPAAKPVAQAAVSKTGFFAGLTARSATVDSIDQAGYGAMPATGASLRTRAEVRAEAIAARDADVDAMWREGGDPQYAVLKRVRHFDTAHMVAGTPAKSGE